MGLIGSQLNEEMRNQMRSGILKGWAGKGWGGRVGPGARVMTQYSVLSTQNPSRMYFRQTAQVQSSRSLRVRTHGRHLKNQDDMDYPLFHVVLHYIANSPDVKMLL
jgi:hypothetical protein